MLLQIPLCFLFADFTDLLKNLVMANGRSDHTTPPRCAMQLQLMLRGEGVKGNGNQTAWESHSDVCTAFLNFLQTLSVSAKQMFLFQANSGKGASVYGCSTPPNSEGFSSSRFLRLILV